MHSLLRHSKALTLRLLLLIFPMIIMGALYLMPGTAEVAEAGSNGQELTIYSCNNLSHHNRRFTFTVTGQNQHGQTKVWTRDAGSSCTVTTNGWYWKGWAQIHVSFYDTNNRLRTISQWTFVPHWMPGNGAWTVYVLP